MYLILEAMKLCRNLDVIYLSALRPSAGAIEATNHFISFYSFIDLFTLILLPKKNARNMIRIL